MKPWNVRPSTARRWAPIVRAYEASGDSVPVYARAHNLNDRTHRWWQSYFRRVGLPAQGNAPAAPASAPLAPPMTFVPVAVEIQAPAAAAPPPPSPTPHVLELRLATVNAKIAVTAATDLALLRRVAEALC